MKIVSSSRRQIAMAVMLALAVVGAAMRYTADNPSLTRDVGTLLLVLWLPAVGNLVAFVIRKLPRRAPPPAGFPQGQAFAAQLRAEIRRIDASPVADPPLDALQRDCMVVVGTEGFRARTATPLSQLLAQGANQGAELQFLRPDLAVPRLPPGTAFTLLAGTALVGAGRVLGPTHPDTNSAVP